MTGSFGVEPISEQEDNYFSLEEQYEIPRIVEWITTNGLSKVCLQFPESQLKDSVEVAHSIERLISGKVYILGDCSIGSCCPDLTAARHLPADGIVHFGYACLTPVTLPSVSPPISQPLLLYVFPKKALCIESLVGAIRTSGLDESRPFLVLYNVAYHHKADEIRIQLANLLGQRLIMTELEIPGITSHTPCSPQCCVSTGSSHHSQVRYARGFCHTMTNDAQNSLDLLYIGSSSDALLLNFTFMFKESECWCLDVKSNGEVIGLNSFNLTKELRQLMYRVEVIKSASVLGLVLASPQLSGSVTTIKYAKRLARQSNKKLYVISLNKPTIANLTNFPDMQVLVVVGCPETQLARGGEQRVTRDGLIQPVVSLLELRLALDPSYPWEGHFSSDFTDLPIDDKTEGNLEERSFEADVSLVTGRMAGGFGGGAASGGDVNSTEIVTKELGQLALTGQDRALLPTSLKTGAQVERSWFGLEPKVGTAQPALATEGRFGTSTGYQNELSQ